jgi:hypothetical protein
LEIWKQHQVSSVFILSEIMQKSYSNENFELAFYKNIKNFFSAQHL